MPITVIAFMLISLAFIQSQANDKALVSPPVLPNHEVKLVPPSIPAGMTSASHVSTEQDVQAALRDGVVQIKIGDAWVPVIGGCCFCPDGANKPLRWEPAKKNAVPAEKR